MNDGVEIMIMVLRLLITIIYYNIRRESEIDVERKFEACSSKLNYTRISVLSYKRLDTFVVIENM